MIATPAPTDQRAGVRPISFVLDNAGVLSPPVVLSIRPEDLTRTEPARATVHQTLGRGVTGWVDHFGEGLPSISISGHTGWRYALGSGEDGSQSFDRLNQLVAHDYTNALQDAADSGTDPDSVKLLFVDMLDNFAWAVVPTQFVLRRSKSRPLLYQYQIALQAISTSVDNPLSVLPFFGSVSAGLSSLGYAQEALSPFSSIAISVARALAFAGPNLAGVAAISGRFLGLTGTLMASVSTSIRANGNAITGSSNQLITVTADFAGVGLSFFRAVVSIPGLPNDVRAEVQTVAAALNEVVCIFRNSLRPRQVYEQFEGIYGSSNCSSTTGGRGVSAYRDKNIFALLQEPEPPPTLSSPAIVGVDAMLGMDPVLAPLSFPEMGRHMNNIVAGTKL